MNVHNLDLWLLELEGVPSRTSIIAALQGAPLWVLHIIEGAPLDLRRQIGRCPVAQLPTVAQWLTAYLDGHSIADLPDRDVEASDPRWMQRAEELRGELGCWLGDAPGVCWLGRRRELHAGHAEALLSLMTPRGGVADDG